MTSEERVGFLGFRRYPAFFKLWVGETVSLFGSQITTLALPLTAVLTLQATPAQLGVLNAARYAPFLLVTLFAGVWVDRGRRRPVLVGANLGRMVLLLLIPLAAVSGLLRVEYLYVVAFLVGVLTVFFDLAYQSFLPSLVRREHLVWGNSRLQASASTAEIGGPGLGGVLVELVTAPFALLFDALSFLVSAISLALIRAPESTPTPPADRGGLRAEIGEGLRVTFGNRYLRAIAGEAATFNLFEQAILTLFVLYATRELGMGAGVLGLTIATGGVGALVGSLVAGYAASRFGLGAALVGSMTLACVAPLLIPLTGGDLAVAVPLLLLAFLAYGIGLGISSVHAVSLRQAVTPDGLLGRMNASYRFLVYGAIPLGALFGGVLGETIGLRPALVVSVLGLLLALAWVFFSPVPGLRRIPEQEEHV
jgi:MFS family permease